MPEAGRSFVLAARSGCGGRSRIEDTCCLVEMTRPELDIPAAGQPGYNTQRAVADQ